MKADNKTMEARPVEIENFLIAVAKNNSRHKPVVEQGGTIAQNWWIDFRGEKAVTVEWRPQQGFGLSTVRSSVYGEGPTEIIISPAKAAERVNELLHAS